MPCVVALTSLPSSPLVISSVSTYNQFPKVYELNHSYKHCNKQKIKITIHKNVSLGGSHAPHVITGCYTIKPHCAMSLPYLVAICTTQILHLLCHSLDSLHYVFNGHVSLMQCFVGASLLLTCSLLIYLKEGLYYTCIM